MTRGRKFYALDNSHPELAKEWDYERNSFNPEHVTEATGKKVWWRCKRNHSFREKITERVKGLACPKCIKQNSQIEREIIHILKLQPNVVNTVYAWNGVNNYADCDGVCELRKIVVEYDGFYWHKDKIAKDLSKTHALLDSGYRVIRIREKGLPSLKNKIISDNYQELTQVKINSKDLKIREKEIRRIIKLTNKLIKVLTGNALSTSNHDNVALGVPSVIGVSNVISESSGHGVYLDTSGHSGHSGHVHFERNIIRYSSGHEHSDDMIFYDYF